EAWEHTLLVDELTLDAEADRFLDAVASTLGDHAVAELVAERAQDPDPAVRAAALASLAALDPHGRGAARAKAGLRDGDARVRRAALEALERHAPDGAAEWVAAAIAGERFGSFAR